MQAYLAVALGSALGGIARYAGASFVSRRLGDEFPWGTLIVNVSGSFLIGLFAALTRDTGRVPLDSAGRQLLMAGFCGGYTTFSAFSLQTLDLMRGGDWLGAGANAIASVICCILAVWLGVVLGSWR